MSKGKIVITSKENRQLPQMRCRVDVKADVILWTFRTEDEAIRASREFMNLGYTYVQRII